MFVEFFCKPIFVLAINWLRSLDIFTNKYVYSEYAYFVKNVNLNLVQFDFALLTRTENNSHIDGKVQVQ